MSIDIPSIVFGVAPLDEIAGALVKSSSEDISKMMKEIPNQTKEIEEQEKAVENEPNEKIKEKAKQNLEEQKKKLEELKQQLKEQRDKMLEDMEKKVQEWVDTANIYAQEIADAATAIPGLAQSYTIAVTEYAATIVNLATTTAEAATAAANPIAPTIMTGAVASAASNMNMAKKAKDDAKREFTTALTRLNTAIFNVEDVLSPITAIPGIGKLILAAVMTPINIVKGIADVAAQLVV